MPNDEKRTPETNAKIEVPKDEFDQILQTELIAQGIIFGETAPEQNVKRFFENIVDNTKFAVAIKVGEQYNVYYPEVNRAYFFDYQYAIGNEYAIPHEQFIVPVTEPILVIEDLKTFTQKFIELAKYVKEQPTGWRPRPIDEEKSDPLIGVWYNAAPIDFVEPIEFIERYTQIMEEKDLVERFQLKPEPLQSRIINANITMDITHEAAVYETPLAMMSVLMISHNGEQIPYELCKVRAGIYEEDGIKKAVLYAVQNATDLKQLKQEIDERIKSETEYTQKANDLYKRLYKEDKTAFLKVFGHIPEEIFMVEDPLQFYFQFKEILMRNLRTRYPDAAEYNNMALYSSLLFRDNPNVKLQIDEKTFDYVKDLAYGIDSITVFGGDTEQTLEDFADTLKIIEEKGVISTEISKSLKTKGVPPNHVVSLTMALSSLQELGVEEVLVPLYLPLRVKDHEIRLGKEQTLELDNRKLTNLINELAYVSANIRGIDIWDYEETPENGGSYMTLKLKPLSSDKPLLQEFVDAGKQVVGEKVE